MRFIQHPSNNSVYDPPPGLTNEECRPLPVTRIMYPGGIYAVRSYWIPSPEEIQDIVKGKPIVLETLGLEVLPVSLSVGDPDDYTKETVSIRIGK